MARRQMSIPGTERQNIPELERVSEEYREICIEDSEIGKRKTAKKHELIALMRAHNKTLHRYDDENGEEIEIELDEAPKLTVHKTGEAETDVGVGVTNPDLDARENNLINQALAAQQDAGVSETEDGEVVPIESAKPKKSKRKGKSK
ncbi:MAG: hypothetical protein AB7O24_04325 [Kofleriaceae bacterium]